MNLEQVTFSPTLAARMRARTRRAAGDACWEFQGARHDFGYGEIFVGRDALGRKRAEHAHRVAYFLEHGSLPSDRQVNHRCDNPPCVRPDHLELGTALANATDRKLRGRGRSPGAQGERNSHAKLTADRVIWARQEWARGRWATYAAMGRELGVTYQTARDIVLRHIWKSAA